MRQKNYLTIKYYLLALKVKTVLAGTLTDSPVIGFLATLAALSFIEKVPNSWIVSFPSEEEILKFKKENYMLKDLQIPFRLHQEDFAQAMGISSSMKYEKKGLIFILLNLKKLFS